MNDKGRDPKELAEIGKGTKFTSDRQPSPEAKREGMIQASIVKNFREEVLKELIKEIKVTSGAEETFVRILVSRIKLLGLSDEEKDLTPEQLLTYERKFKIKKDRLYFLMDVIDKLAVKYATFKVSGGLDVQNNVRFLLPKKEINIEVLEAELEKQKKINSDLKRQLLPPAGDNENIEENKE